MISIHKRCSSCNLTCPPSGHCLEIFGQSVIRVIRDYLAESNFRTFSPEISSNSRICSTIMQETPQFLALGSRKSSACGV